MKLLESFVALVGTLLLIFVKVWLVVVAFFVALIAALTWKK